MDTLAKLLQEGNYLVVAIFLVIWVVIKLPSIMGFYRSGREQRSISIANAIADPDVNTELKDHFIDELNIEHFKNIHGVRLSMPMLNAVLVLNERVSDSVSFRHVLKTVKLVPDISEIREKAYRVKLPKYDVIFCIYSMAVGIIISILGYISAILTIYSVFSDFNIGFMVSGSIFLPLGIFMLNDGSALISVRHVNKALEAFEEKSAQPDQ
ncbi:hypothetical protein [Vibrio nigripulchritudo]|uniref:hypothetical protein n=1 Tax=Vibrio nigripulchritudo TaxID=28173 RepID=UPI0005F9B936|nr:hypothetical protein [Vibrio nigripulchritudo]KJY79519.1 hypothetical protein TW74_08690 [Vibrio nigripulchritudo]